LASLFLEHSVVTVIVNENVSSLLMTVFVIVIIIITAQDKMVQTQDKPDLILDRSPTVSVLFQVNV